MSRNDLFVDLAVKVKFLTAGQLEDCRKLQGLLSQNGFALTLPEILIRKEYLNRDQARMINMAIRYDEMREEDTALGAFIARKGFLAQDKITDCLGAQEVPYRDGRHFPRLQDILLQRNHLTPQQVHVILRAYQQLDAGPGAKASEGSSPRIPVPQPAVPPPEPARAPVSAGALKSMEAGLQLDLLKVAFRKARVKDGQAGDRVVHILEIQGMLDGHTFRRFDQYLNSVIDGDAVQLVLNCDKLDYVSSAGLGVLAGAAKRCRDRQGDLRLCNVSEKVKKIINLVGLQSVLRMYDAERGALMSFRFV